MGSVSTAKTSLRTILDEGIEIASKLAFAWLIDPERLLNDLPPWSLVGTNGFLKELFRREKYFSTLTT